MKLTLNKKLEGSKTSHRGFALLFSVLIASLLLSIGLSIFSIALKELAISTASRQSVHAFFAADSGRECALYWDIKKGKIATLISGYTPGVIKCGGASIVTNYVYSPVSTPSLATEVDTTIDNTPLVPTLPDDANFNVTIVKRLDRAAVPAADLTTVLTSYGHDSTADDRVERAIEQDY